jgi:putative membrane protein
MWEHMPMWGQGWGPGWGVLGLMHVAWWALVIMGLVALVRWVSRRGASGAPPAQEDRAVAILRERYARGEIDKAEFEERKRDLAG